MQSFSLNSFIMSQAADYIKPEIQPEIEAPKLVKVQQRTSSKLALVKAAKDQQTRAAEIAKDNEGVIRLPMMVKGDLSARDFLVALRRASDHNSKINVIAGFMGYDPNEPYGPQEVTAILAAQREIRGAFTGPTYREQRSAFASLTGFVAGLPSESRKRLMDLIGRETMATDLHIACLKMASESGCKLGDISPEQFKASPCCNHHAMAMVEVERLSHIQADLVAMGHRREV